MHQFDNKLPFLKINLGSSLTSSKSQKSKYLDFKCCTFLRMADKLKPDLWVKKIICDKDIHKQNKINNYMQLTSVVAKGESDMQLEVIIGLND